MKIFLIYKFYLYLSRNSYKEVKEKKTIAQAKAILSETTLILQADVQGLTST